MFYDGKFNEQAASGLVGLYNLGNKPSNQTSIARRCSAWCLLLRCVAFALTLSFCVCDVTRAVRSVHFVGELYVLLMSDV